MTVFTVIHFRNLYELVGSLLHLKGGQGLICFFLTDIQKDKPAWVLSCLSWRHLQNQTQTVQQYNSAWDWVLLLFSLALLAQPPKRWSHSTVCLNGFDTQSMTVFRSQPSKTGLQDRHMFSQEIWSQNTVAQSDGIWQTLWNTLTTKRLHWQDTLWHRCTNSHLGILRGFFHTRMMLGFNIKGKLEYVSPMCLNANSELT